ncbi:peptidase M64 [candidate division KSB1 bacterium]|nr:peptidase M64 [candidate division KSB1 bacterium]NIR71430.1 peptidase M64 [candidate division KSB1 bacterium]NIS23351.1 peptidase M64 [candidate division KSB1 bacterium]NIT70242.1 peptidase M64 [candidate division KSB1 bacterium]NIU23965.1 peptidase M64 [candidate division KSB1 bacterium]
MKLSIGMTFILNVSVILAQPQSPFEQFFENKTMRVDYYHTGTATQEHISLDQVHEEGVWAGSHQNLIDTLNLGKYLLKVFDVETNQMIYSRGFASIYGEWETTGEAKDEVFRTFHESVLLPFPKKKAQVVIAKRDKWMHFYDIFTTVIDPNSRFVNREKRGRDFDELTLLENGPPHKKVDFLLLGDGYTKDELDKFRTDVERWKETILEMSPFKEHASELNILAIEVISEDSGIDEPRKNLWRNTALGCSYNSFDSPRYVLTYENRTIRDIAAAVPYDFIYILVNSARYGGGGIYGLYATGMTGVENPEFNWHLKYMITHEFGHSLAGLGDEYYSSSVSYLDFYPEGVEPTAPNVTALLDPEHLKWKTFVEENTPLPTPWPKAHYDSLEAVRATWDRSKPGYYEKWAKLRKQQVEKMQASEYYGKVGAFEGAGYSATGLYRPSMDCRMFSLSMVPYCPVCAAAIARVIEFYSE